MKIEFNLFQWNGFMRKGTDNIKEFNSYYEHNLLNIFMTRKDLFEKILIKIYINDEVKEKEFKHYIPEDTNISHLCHESPIKYINEFLSLNNNINRIP